MAEIFDYVREFVRREIDGPTGADSIKCYPQARTAGSSVRY
jgi:hypothetical protein